MKSIKKYNHQFLIVLFAFVFALSGCEERSDFGMEILPKEDLITVKNIVIKNDISSFTFREDSIRTDESTNSLLGSFHDPVFGITNIDFATQFRLQSFPGYGENPQADSIKLYLYYRIIYGDTVTAQKFKVYELESPLDVDAEYNQHVDLKSMAYSQLLGEIEYVPVVKQDSVTLDTFYQLITIPLDISLAEKLVNADSTDMINNDDFLEYFKGLYIETEQVSEEGGTILSLEASSTDVFQGSALVLYYNNQEIRDLAVNGDSSIVMPFVISKFSARVNSIEHDYSGTPFENDINKQSTEDTLIYIQSTGGLKSNILIANLETWKDSVNTAINKAELIFEIDTIASDIHNFAPPQQLLFTVIDSTGAEYLPIDYVFSPTFYGGYLWNDYTYRFNITQHLQEIIRGSIGNFGFFLTPAYKNNQANRVVIKGSNSAIGVKLIITYSKYNI
ncbi:MAG: DUF4270 domain-containing protein [Draconibacterium sp.]|nr:DUF4270 domain-containing protein [Draconibacterium sp.]